MKADIHPEYKEVVFQDVTSDFKFLTRSTLGSKETIKWEDGHEYPLNKVDVSSAKHPCYTGQKKIKIGRTQWRDRVSKYVTFAGAHTPLKKQETTQQDL